MFSHSTPIIPRGSFQVACEIIWDSFGVGDHFGSYLGRFWGSFGVGDHLGSGIISGRVQLTLPLFLLQFTIRSLQLKNNQLEKY